MKHHESIGLRDLIEDFLFSLRAEGKSNGTIEYYSYLLHPLLSYASEQSWSDNALSLDTHRLREFLTWTATRTFELKVANNGGKIVKKAKPSTAWPYYRVLRRFFNWAVEEGYLKSSPLATIHFKSPPEPPVEGYTIDEVKRLLAACDLNIRTAAHFLDILDKRMPFPVKAIQVDGGAEFEAIFEEECQRRGIKLFILPPRSPKLNGGVERAHRTHTEEFYEVTESSFDIAELGKELLEWERVYNTVRPHQALGYLTPSVFLEQQKYHQGKELMCH